MSAVGDRFVSRLGKPDPATRPGLRFSRDFQQQRWAALHREVGAGWYLDRFLFLFGEGLERLQACLDAWSFLVAPDHPDRMILGRNAYGAILTLENANTEPGQERVCVLDPTLVKYWSDPNIKFVNLIGNWLPQMAVANFFERGVYHLWVSANQAYLEDDIILAMAIPLGLGGAWHPKNFNEENIFAYYETTAPVFAKAFARMAQQPDSR